MSAPGSRVGALRAALVLAALAVSLALFAWRARPGGPPSGREADARPGREELPTPKPLAGGGGAARGAERAEASVAIDVRVADGEDGSPLAGASVVLRAGGGTSERAETDATGRVRKTVPAGAALSVRAELEGYTPASREVVATSGLEVRLQLRRDAGWVRGRVTNAGGHPVPDVTVCVWPRSRTEPDLYRAVSDPAARSALGVAVATTRADGAFDVHVGSDDVELAAAAGGRGWVSPGVEPVARAPAETALRVFPLHGCAVRWRDAKVGELRTSPHLSAGAGSAVEVRSPWAERVDRDWPALGILGLSYEDLRARPPGEVLFLYVDTQPGEADEIGPLTLRKEVPGYEPRDVSVMLPRVRGAPVVVDVALDADTECWCSTWVVVVPPCADDDLVRTATLPPASVRLEPVDGGPAVRFVVPDFGRTELDLGGVPCGTYEMTWRTANGFFDCRGTGLCGGVVDLTGDSATLLVDASGLGCLECTVLDAEGDAYRGLVLIDVGRVAGEKRWWSSTSWLRPPYLFEDLPEGEYDLVVRHPPALRGAALERVRVTSGGRTTCTLQR